jgi:HD-GYP domain-containing protein (c-di-GMP phosphodiesterase class II)
MTCPRAYRDALDWNLAVQHLRSLSGTAFDPGVVRLLDAVAHRLESVHDEIPQPLASVPGDNG